MTEPDTGESACARGFRTTTRRSLLISTLSAGLSGLCYPALAREGDLRSLGAVLDTLVPADEFSPSASDLGLESEMERLIADNDLLTRLFVAALGWLDEVGSRPFRELDEERQVEILTAMAASDYNRIPGRFFHIVRALTVELYFARPEAISGYPLNPAPQPAGYPPPWN